MPTRFRLLAPHDAPAGNARAMDVVTTSLGDPDIQRARIATAFARKAGVVRLVEAVRKLHDRGGRVEAVVGIDHRGTSEEALRLLLEWFDEVNVLHEPRSFVTFHPKMYLFDGASTARALVGSHNLTLGGLELNYEAGIVLEFSLPSESASWSAFEHAWAAMLPAATPNSRPLTGKLIDQLVKSGLVQPERVVQARARKERKELASLETSTSALPFGSTTIAPASPLPKDVASASKVQRPGGLQRPIASASVLIIEVVPKKNSEVFLSSTALKQNPGFFRWPWAGLTVPKLAKNKPYPKMEPNPRIRVIAHDQAGHVAKTSDIEPEVVRYVNADVRMTVGQDLLPFIPPYSVFVIRHADAGVDQDVDYEIEVHPDGSPEHKRWLALCDQPLPSGGKARARRMGWA